jgi:hypothetical protein
MTASLERRKNVLALAREHDFLILEGMCATASALNCLMCAAPNRHMLQTTLTITCITALRHVHLPTLRLSWKRRMSEGCFALTVYPRLSRRAFGLALLRALNPFCMRLICTCVNILQVECGASIISLTLSTPISSDADI